MMTSPDMKLDWIFRVFDQDFSGAIEEPELEVILQGLLSMTGTEFDEEDLHNCKMEIIDVCDTDGDFSITKREFIKNALNSVFLRSIL